MLVLRRAMNHHWPVSQGKVYRFLPYAISIIRFHNHNSTVDILLNATGNVPIMKKRKWAVDQDKPIGWIMSFIHKYLKLEPQEKLVFYLTIFVSREFTDKTVVVVSVSLCKSNVCTVARSNRKEPVRMLRIKWQTSLILL